MIVLYFVLFYAFLLNLFLVIFKLNKKEIEKKKTKREFFVCSFLKQNESSMKTFKKKKIVVEKAKQNENI